MNEALISLRAPGPGSSQGTLTAFCATCPEPEAVTRFLQGLGFHLAFFLAADKVDTAMADLPPLPAQYHYEDEVGTCVEYLAGTDIPCLADDENDPQEITHSRYPPHASRFWLTPGGHELVTRRVRDALAEAFSLRWQEVLAGTSIKGVA